MRVEFGAVDASLKARLDPICAGSARGTRLRVSQASRSACLWRTNALDLQFIARGIRQQMKSNFLTWAERGPRKGGIRTREGLIPAGFQVRQNKSTSVHTKQSRTVVSPLPTVFRADDVSSSELLVTGGIEPH